MRKVTVKMGKRLIKQLIVRFPETSGNHTSMNQSAESLWAGTEVKVTPVTSVQLKALILQAQLQKSYSTV